MRSVASVVPRFAGRSRFHPRRFRACQLRFRAVDPDAGVNGVKQVQDPGLPVASAANVGLGFDLAHLPRGSRLCACGIMERGRIVISSEILESAHLSEPEMLLEIALTLFAQERLTLGQAAKLSNLPQLEFQKALAARKIPVHYDLAEFEEDLKTLERLAAR
jgi:predicted HTH domain antitoxin